LHVYALPEQWLQTEACQARAVSNSIRLGAPSTAYAIRIPAWAGRCCRRRGLLTSSHALKDGDSRTYMVKNHFRYIGFLLRRVPNGSSSTGFSDVSRRQNVLGGIEVRVGIDAVHLNLN
jgi:hypothetical protein